MKERIFYLDLLRALAIIGVIVSHCLTKYLDAPDLICFNMFVGSAAIFFMTSGALVLPLREPTRQFLKRRFRSFMPELIMWSVIYLILYSVYGAEVIGVEADGTSRYKFMPHLKWALFEPTWGAGWFMYALIGLYLFVPVISPWIQRASRRGVECFLLIWLVGGVNLLAAQHVEVTPQEGIFGPFYNYLGYMVAGYYLARWPVAERSLRDRIVFWTAAAGIGVIVAVRLYLSSVRYGFMAIMNNDLMFTLMAWCILVFALGSLIKKAPRIISAAVTWVSVYSLGIYMSHTLFAVFLFRHFEMTWAERIVSVLAAAMVTALIQDRVFRAIRARFLNR